MKPFVVAAIAIAAGIAFASSVSDLTDSEKLTLRNDQVEFFQAQSALQQTPQWQREETAREKLNKDVNEIYSARKINQTQYILCDGPGSDSTSPCFAVKTGELRLVEKPQPPKKP